MANYTITAANVVPTDSSLVANRFHNDIAGGTITAGMPVYVDAADNNTVKAARANASGTATIRGIACSNASDGQPVRVQYSGYIDMGFSSSGVGDIVVLSDSTAGAVMPSTDLGSTDYISLIGVVISPAHVVHLSIVNTGVVIV